MKLEEFEKIEQELQLDTETLFGVAWWDLWRYTIYVASSQPDERRLNKSQRPLRLLWQGITHLRYFFKRRRTIFILRHPRFKREENRYVDIYTDIIGRDLANLGYSALYLEKQTGQSRPLDTGPIYPLALMFSLSALIARMTPSFLLGKGKLRKVANVLQKLGVANRRLNEKLVFRSVVGFRVRVLLYRLLFKVNKPKVLFLVVSCGNEDIICAASMEGVLSIELQHGSPTRGKLNYDYSNSIEKRYFPDVFLSFGPFFSSRIQLPAKCKHIVDFGYPYLQHKRKNVRGGRQKKYDLLVLSQPDCDNYIVLFLSKLVQILPKSFSIRVQLHPQYFSQQNPYSELEGPNFDVADSLKSSLYDAFNLSRSAITVYSTAIYEARAFGLQAFVLLEERNLLNEFLALGEAVAIDPCDNIRYNLNKITDGISSSDSNASSVFAVYSRENIEGIMRLAGN